MNRQVESENVRPARQSRTLTRDALSLLIHGVMRRARGVNRAAQLLGFLIGCRLYELDRGLQDAELQGHRHLWEKTNERRETLSRWEEM